MEKMFQTTNQYTVQYQSTDDGSSNPGGSTTRCHTYSAHKQTSEPTCCVAVGRIRVHPKKRSVLRSQHRLFTIGLNFRICTVGLSVLLDNYSHYVFQLVTLHSNFTISVFFSKWGLETSLQGVPVPSPGWFRSIAKGPERPSSHTWVPQGIITLSVHPVTTTPWGSVRHGWTLQCSTLP